MKRQLERSLKLVISKTTTTVAFMGPLLIGIVTPALACNVEPPPINQNMNYGQARDNIIKAGWFKSKTRWQDVQSFGIEGRAKQFWYAGYKEVQACSPTGEGLCWWHFIDAFGNRLEVATIPHKNYARDYGANPETFKEDPRLHQLHRWTITTKAEVEQEQLEMDAERH